MSKFSFNNKEIAEHFKFCIWNISCIYDISRIQDFEILILISKFFKMYLQMYVYFS